MVNNREATDPGSTGHKLSKSGTEEITERRNKSYGKVLDAEITWIHAVYAGSSDAGELLIRWQKKAEWHEKEFGW